VLKVFLLDIIRFTRGAAVIRPLVVVLKFVESFLRDLGERLGDVRNRSQRRAPRRAGALEDAIELLFGDLAESLVGVIDLANYRGPRALWRRLGLAPYEGTSASFWRKQGGLDGDEWSELGFSPARLGQIHGCVTIPLFMAKAKSIYGKIYAARREHTAVKHPDWTKMHSHEDGLRIMTKEMVKHLWRRWRKHGRADVRSQMAKARPDKYAGQGLVAKIAAWEGARSNGNRKSRRVSK
jgi:hypothetical protein